LWFTPASAITHVGAAGPMRRVPIMKPLSDVELLIPNSTFHKTTVAVSSS
jgi:hypothetical protein